MNFCRIKGFQKTEMAFVQMKPNDIVNNNKSIKLKNYFVFCLLSAMSLSSFAQSGSSDSLAKRHQEMMNIIMTRPKLPVKTIGIFVYDGFNTIDAMGPYQVLSQLSGTKIFLIAKNRGMIRNQRGLKFQVDTSIAEVKHLDIVLIPGGAKETFLVSKDTAVLNWIKAIDQTSVYTTSVCTGAWILGATDLLKGKNATTNWYRAEEMLKRYGADFKQERWVKDGKYWTSAGVTAGIDMSLAIVKDIMGDLYAKSVMLDMEYDPHPPLVAGSVTNTDPLVVDMMREMYDMVMLPLIHQR